MKVVVIGANGQIGRHLVKLLHMSEAHDVRAVVRNGEQAEALERQGIEAVVADLEGSVDALAEAFRGGDAVVFTAGSGGKTGADLTLLVDLDGAVKSVEAAEQSGVQRFVMVSAIQAHNRENWNPKIRHYFVAKHYADRMLMQSSLNYTIVRPGGLTNDPGTGHVAAASDLSRDVIPREDVAATIAAALDEPKTYHRAFDLVTGNTPIAEALKQL